ncbi:MAG: hypothetical protein SNJ57_01340 [Cyanobacteriota bacterium]
MRRILMAVGVGLVAMAPIPVMAQLRLPNIPGLPGGVPIPPVPGLGELMGDRPPVSTSLEDAKTEISLLDTYNPQRVAPASQLRRGEHGSFVVVPGVYEYEAQSYCLRAGTHGPGQGDGYLYAPLLGKREDIVRRVLQNSVAHPDIPQRDIQLLLWAILSRTRFNDLSSELQAAGRRLLTREDINDLNGGALGNIPPEVQRRIFAELPPAVRQVVQAEANLRSLLTRGNASYAEMERIAVLVGEIGMGEGSREVPAGRWSMHPSGVFVRYIPSGYSRTKIQLALPDRYTITRDSLGRITSVISSQGDRTEVVYDDRIPPRPHPADPQLVAYAFQSVRLTRPNPANRAQIERFEVQNRGWAFTHAPRRTASNSLTLAAAMPLSRLFIAQSDRYLDWARRGREAYDQQQAVRDYWERIDRATRDRSAQDIDDLTNLGHYRDGVEAATTGSTGDRVGWIADHHERQRGALLYAICVLEERCEPGGSATYDPSGDVAVPGNTSRQRLGQSARGF